MSEECIFCDILAGKLPVSMVYQDEQVSAFMDIQPVNAGHVLVIPNTHVRLLPHLDPDTAAQMFRVAQRITAALPQSGIRCEGVNLYLADGDAAGQEVRHVHLHIFPRFTGDGFGLTFSPDYVHLPPRDALDQAAAMLRNVLTS